MSFKNLVARTAMVCAALTLMSATALAQGTIIVIDYARVMTESDAGKNVKGQIETIGATMKSELKAAAAPLISEEKSLMTEINGLSPAELNNRPDLKARTDAYKSKAVVQLKEENFKLQELQVTQAKAMKQVHDKLMIIMDDLAKEKNADVVLDKAVIGKAAMVYGPTTDLTDTAIARLNGQMKTVAVTRERLPRN